MSARIITDIVKLLGLFSAYCRDRETMVELEHMAGDSILWAKGHALFNRIRLKTLVAERAGDARLATQYLFEEVCAKTLYNLSDSPAPFDADSPYWIVTNAFALARRLQIPDSEILSIVAA